MLLILVEAIIADVTSQSQHGGEAKTTEGFHYDLTVATLEGVVNARKQVEIMIAAWGEGDRIHNLSRTVGSRVLKSNRAQLKAE